MASLLEKVQVLVSADLNRIFDRALRSNEPAVFQQHLRELQAMQEQLGQQLAALQAEVSEARRRSDAQQALVVQQDQEVDELLRRGLQEEALASQDRLNQSRVLAAQMTERVQALAGELAGLVEAKARLDARITALRQNEPAMEGLVGLARAKELTAAAMSSLDDLAGAGDPDVARVVGSIRTRLAEAEAQIRELEQRALAHGETPDVLKRRQLEDQLEARKARLGLSTGALDGESPGSGPQQPVNS